MSAQPIAAMTLGPALLKLQDVKPGQHFDLGAAGQMFTAGGGKAGGVFELVSMPPAPAGLRHWEWGYDPFPDASWATMSQKRHIFTPGKTGQVSLILQIPDEPHNYNRHFMLAVVLRPEKKGGLAVGLQLAARVQIETATSTAPDSGGGVVAVIPSRIRLQGAPGALVGGTVQLRSDHKESLQLSFHRFAEIEPLARKHPRYQSPGYRLMPDGAWLTAMPPAQELAAGARTTLKLAARVPKDAKAGQRFEEMLYWRWRAPEQDKADATMKTDTMKTDMKEENATAKAGKPEGNTASSAQAQLTEGTAREGLGFVRIQYEVIASDKAKADTAAEK